MAFRKKHNQMSFYKYLTSETAKLVLKNRKLKATCPLDFNDPFDVQTGMHYDFEISELCELYFQRMKFLVGLDEDPIFKNENDFSRAITFMREKKKSHEFPETQLRKLSAELISIFATSIEEARREFAVERINFIKTMRVLCLTENHESVLMWSHYADHHRGVVVKLKVAKTVKEDDFLWLAEKVRYTPNAIPLMGKNEILDEIFGMNTIGAEEIGRRLNNTKFDVWSYEKEWRVWTIAEEGDDAGFFLDIDLKKIEAIYFGCKCPKEDVFEIKSIAEAGNQEIEFYQAKKHAFDFKLQFEKI